MLLGQLSHLVQETRTADANEGCQFEPLLFGRDDQAFEHTAELSNGLFTLDIFFVAMAPERELPHFGL